MLGASETELTEAKAAEIQARMQRTGVRTSEFKYSVLAVIVGAGIAAYGHFIGDAALTSDGVDLAKFAVGAYALARGLAKRG